MSVHSINQFKMTWRNASREARGFGGDWFDLDAVPGTALMTEGSGAGKIWGKNIIIYYTSVLLYIILYSIS